MAEYVVRHFAWDQRGAAFPPSPLPKDFQALYPSYELAVAKEAAEDYELPELPQVIFYAMLLNEAKRLGVLHGRAPRTLESALTELHWSTFESGCGSTFYVMLLNEVVELGAVHGFTAEGLRSALVGLRWSSFEAWMSRIDHELREAQLRQQAVAVEVRGPSDGQVFKLQETRGEVGVAGYFLRGCTSLVSSLYKRRWDAHRTSYFLLQMKSEKREKLERNLFPNFASTEQAAKYVYDHFRWSLRDPLAPDSRPLPSPL
ncbi:hypothetical protein Cgig2_017140 [Carnegiea gigantea]|uniref:Uncharacterized protein n=1 Tax=Carnegiea gigantea TaxID=171969 RepID=A0A9Q1Q4T2_9CARY|nr:hypothetical protein Cgig2_017140 [Carnegiea gigantea]